ncbi:MAG: phosphatidylserine/phosphatidylglycerophosphate/cardiolipin synthase family protein [Bdellovibrionales bacterium]|nr:phosphatidylserine/phosphatidylglycerophosphate/cardiolipin synthase family protein [Bdellovibrionales bacterium]
MISFLFFVWAAASGSAFGWNPAEESVSIDRYPWVPVRFGDIRMIPSARRDLWVRLDLIRRAQSTIDVVVFEQKFDERVGKPILTALREAADRGVRVRFLTTWLAVVMKDSANESGRYLTEPVTRVPVEYRVFNGNTGPSRNLGFDSSVHEKLMIVDGEVVLATGRGHSDDYLEWLDSSSLIRGPLVHHTRNAVNALMVAAARENPALVTRPAEQGEVVQSFYPPAVMQAEGQDLAGLQGDLDWIEAAFSGRAEDEALLRSNRGRGRVLHHDYVAQAQRITSQLPNRPYRRWAGFDDPMVASVIRKLDARPAEARFSMLSVTIHPELKRAIKRAARAGTKITILTNNKESGFDPFNVPWRTAIPDMVNLADERNVTLLGLRRGNGWPYQYMHRKVSVIDRTVYMGSHNLNISSTTFNDELSYEIEDPVLAREMRDLFDEDARLSATPMGRQFLLDNLDGSILWMVLGHNLIGTF